jgi:hypothetical protein
VADKRCDNGHFIDESWDICPYCPAEPVDQIPIARPTRSTEPDSRPVAVPSPAASAQRRDPVTSPGMPAAIGGAMSAAPMERTVAAQRIDAAAQVKRYVVGWLIGLDGASRGESYPLRMGRNVIGRDRRADIVVNDDQASSHHADLVFRPEERRFILMDHNSTNGTYVNEVEIAPRRDLTGRDIVRIGGHRYLFLPLCHEGFFWDEEGALR